jgi:hypothetical protein
MAQVNMYFQRKRDETVDKSKLESSNTADAIIDRPDFVRNISRIGIRST